jgi:acyl-CoA dehydrogenase
MRYPSDKLDRKLAALMTGNNHFRNRLKSFLYLSGDPQQPVDRMEHALQLIINADELSKKVGDVKRAKFGHLKAKLEKKLEKKEITQEEMEQLLAVEAARWDAILVDEFTFESMKQGTFNSVIDYVKSPFI